MANALETEIKVGVSIALGCLVLGAVAIVAAHISGNQPDPDHRKQISEGPACVAAAILAKTHHVEMGGIGCKVDVQPYLRDAEVWTADAGKPGGMYWEEWLAPNGKYGFDMWERQKDGSVKWTRNMPTTSNPAFPQIDQQLRRIEPPIAGPGVQAAS